MSKFKVYIAGPIQSSGDYMRNVSKAIQAAERVYNDGHIPFIPHTHCKDWHFLYPKGSKEWIEFDLEWLKECDALVRLEGESEGADIEVEFAKNHDIPVYYGVDSFLETEF